MATPPNTDLEVLEDVLQGRDATLEAAMAWLHRKLQGADVARLRRIELRYAPQGPKPIDRTDAQARLGELCRQIGLEGVALSVRTHELPLDNDLGHLRIRLLLERRAQKEGGGSSWLRWLNKLYAKVVGLDDNELSGTPDANQPLRDAIALLQQALDLAVQQHTAAGHLAQVQGLHIVVCSSEIHQHLAPRMPPADTHNALLWLSRELMQRGIQPDAQWQVRYEYRSPVSDSTQMVEPDALSARLLLAGQAAPTPPGPQPIDTPMPSPDGETPLPEDDTTNSAATPAPQVLLRVLGTWQAGVLQPLPQPFEASLGDLPTQFSRSMLELAGFTATAQGALAAAASNSTPLGFAADGQGGIKLHTAARPGGLPMYHFVADGQPCLGEHPLTGPLQLVVNGPARLQNGLWPLVIEVRPSGTEPG